MNVHYPLERIPEPPWRRPSIFLDGARFPRIIATTSWESEALELLEETGFDGDVFVSITRDEQPILDPVEYERWRMRYLEFATAIGFWLPYNIERRPDFRALVEIGLFAKSDKAVFGWPAEVGEMPYLQMVVTSETVMRPSDTLEGLVARVADLADRIHGAKKW